MPARRWRRRARAHQVLEDDRDVEAVHLDGDAVGDGADGELVDDAARAELARHRLHDVAHERGVDARVRQLRGERGERAVEPGQRRLRARQALPGVDGRLLAAQRRLEARDGDDGAIGLAKGAVVAHRIEVRPERAQKGAEVAGPGQRQRLAAVEPRQQELALAGTRLAARQRLRGVADGEEPLLEQLVAQAADEERDRRLQLGRARRQLGQRAPSLPSHEERQRHAGEHGQRRRGRGVRGQRRRRRSRRLVEERGHVVAERRQLGARRGRFRRRRQRREELGVQIGGAIDEAAIAARARQRQVQGGIHRRRRRGRAQRLARAGLVRRQERDAAPIIGVGAAQQRMRARAGGGVLVERLPRLPRGGVARVPAGLGAPPLVIAVTRRQRRGRGEHAAEDDGLGAAIHPVHYTRCYDRPMRAVLGILVLALSSVAEAAPTIDVYTMGVGDELFSAFGHAAVCVTDERQPRGRCYNYGTADFSTPVPLTWSFIRGRALFWVSTTDTAHMLNYYLVTGRAVWRQTLTLSPEEGTRVAAELAASAEEGAKYYRYHHFDDNCTTRIRDILDRATGGRLSRDRQSRGKTFRQWARQGFAGDWPLLAAVDLLLGRSSDRTTDSWQAMFLPSELRGELTRRFAAAPTLIVAGKARAAPGATWLGGVAYVVAGALLALAILAGTRVGRRARTAALAATGIFLGLLGTILYALAVLSTFPELTRNELLLTFWPTDFLLPVVGRRYLDVRIGVLLLVVVAHVGLLVQPLAPSLLALLPLLMARVTAARTTQG